MNDADRYGEWTVMYPNGDVGKWFVETNGILQWWKWIITNKDSVSRSVSTTIDDIYEEINQEIDYFTNTSSIK